MCQYCNYREMLQNAGLSAGTNRLSILEIIGENNTPLTAGEIYRTLNRTHPINRVTVYRILDLFVEKGLVDRISTGGRAFHYGLAPNDHHSPHPHFYCTRCGGMQCLSPDSLQVDTQTLLRLFPGRVDNVEIRVDGVCRTCLRSQGRAG